MSDTPDRDDAGLPSVVVMPRDMAGVWANNFQVGRSEHEVTIDFARFDHSAPPPGQGIIVARVAFSYPMLSELADELTREWQAYAWENEEVMRRGSEGDAPDAEPDD